MTDKVQAASTTFTHDGNGTDLKVEQGDARLNNSQEAMMLIDPASLESGFTHSDTEPKMPGKTKAPTTASRKPVAITKKLKANGALQQQLVDEELPAGGKIAELDNDVDPSAGYLNKEAGMPVINNASVDPEEDEDGEFMDDDEADPLAASTEFDDLPSLSAGDEVDDGEFEPVGMGTEAPVEEPEVEADMTGEPNEAPVEEVADFEAKPESDEQMPLVDCDDVDDKEGSEALAFASIGASVHVIRSNRIIASMGPAAARKLNISDVYLSTQYHDVTAHAVDTKGLRKGLVQQGFTLAKVTLSASKATSKVVKAKVEAGMKAKIEAIQKQNKAMEHSLMIAAVGINKKFFKNFDNPLKAALITELKQAGVRGATQLVSSVFAEQGVEYAKALLTLANRIAAMPEEVRDANAEALDMTSDGDFEEDDMSELHSEVEEPEEDEEFEEFGAPKSVTAALNFGPRRVSASQTSGSKVIAGVSDVQRTNALLFGDLSLVG